MLPQFKNVTEKNSLKKSRPEAFYKKGLYKIFVKFIKKHFWCSRYLIKLNIWKPEALLKSDSSTGVSLWILWNV